MSKKVIIGMSGGVDSSVAAALLVEQGYDVTGVIMKIWDERIMMGQTGRHACFGPDEKEDVEKAREVCERLGIPLIEIDLKDAYKHTVLDYFVSEYACGRTPNPCVRCNSRMKFGAMVDRVRASGVSFDLFATGHYVRKRYLEQYGGFVLHEAVDTAKDQTYFLYRITREQLRTALFPLGELTKEQVREIALRQDLGFEDIPESQDFIGGDYSMLLRKGEPGEIVNSAGDVLGSHRGIHHYTIGQRRGLGISAERPLYVLRIDPVENRVVVGFDEELYGHELIAHDLTWLTPEDPAVGDCPIVCQAKIRSQQQAFPATVYREGPDRLRIRFSEPQRAIAPGQSVVLYQDGVVLGGGVIGQQDRTTSQGVSAVPPASGSL